MKSSLSSIWFEYESFGCKEMISLRHSKRESEVYQIIMRSNISKDWKDEVGKARVKLRDVEEENRVEGRDRGVAYTVLEARMVELCRKCRWSIENRIDLAKQTSVIDSIVDDEICAKDCLSGFWSIVIESLLVCIAQVDLTGGIRRSHFIDVLVETLVSSQEYALASTCERELIDYIPHSEYAKSLIQYARTITMREASQAFTQLIYLSRLEKYEKANPDKSLGFLITNQKAYCYAVLGDLSKALEAEAIGLRVANSLFTEYICMLNITRLLLRCGKPEFALASLLCAMTEKTLSIGGGNYEILAMIYLGKIARMLDKDAGGTTWRSRGSSVNWRVAQGMGLFRYHSNYAHDLQMQEKAGRNVDLGVFGGKVVMIDLTVFKTLGLQRITSLLEESKLDRTIGIYQLEIRIMDQMMSVTISESL